jgi:hypothetical protein
VARNFSGPHAVSEILGFAGVVEALISFLATLFAALEALAQDLQASFE